MEEINKRIQIGLISKRVVFIGRPQSFILLFLALLIILFTPQIWLKIKYKDLIYSQVDVIPHRKFAVVFGAWVNEDHSLSDITRERVEAGIELYNSRKVDEIFFSGDNRSNQQAEEMANYATMKGVNPNDIIIDKLGIDTNDTCKHFSEISLDGIIVTQGYHLPRTLLMCEKSKIDAVGLAVDKLGILSSRGDNLAQIYSIRIWRLTREAVLTWSFILGTYDKLSPEAEMLAEKGK